MLGYLILCKYAFLSLSFFFFFLELYSIVNPLIWSKIYSNKSWKSIQKLISELFVSFKASGKNGMKAYCCLRESNISFTPSMYNLSFRRELLNFQNPLPFQNSWIRCQSEPWHGQIYNQYLYPIYLKISKDVRTQEKSQVCLFYWKDQTITNAPLSPNAFGKIHIIHIYNKAWYHQ